MRTQTQIQTQTQIIQNNLIDFEFEFRQKKLIWLISNLSLHSKNNMIDFEFEYGNVLKLQI